MSTCWPGRCPCQAGACSRRLLTRNVSTMISRTSTGCHSSRRAGAAIVSISVISLLFPGVSVIVIAQRLPETAFILFHEAQPPNPFGALPKIKMRNEHPGWATMRRRNRQTLVSGRDHSLPLNEILNGDIGRVTPVAMGHDVRLRWLREARCLQ